MLRRKPLLVLVGLVSATLGAASLAGCPGTAAGVTYTPITGIVIQSSSLVAGVGCGTGAGQVYRYAAVLHYDDDGGVRSDVVASGVFDCYSDAIFSNLPADEAGSSTFSIDILAYDQAAFPSALDCVSGTTEAGSPLPCPGDDPGTLASNEGTPTYTTTCTATQGYGVPGLAGCEPLTPTAPAVDAGEAGPAAGMPITVATTGFVLPEGGTLDCTSGFTAAQASYTAGAQSGQTSVTTCPSALTISPTVAGTTYAITVQLLRGATAVATVACTAQASASQPVTATCQPATLAPGAANDL